MRRRSRENGAAGVAPFLVLLLAGCPSSESPGPRRQDEAATGALGVVRLGEPPIPAHLDDFGDRIAARIRDALEAVRIAPDSATAWGTLGEVLEVRSLRELAATCYAQAVLRDPEDARWSYRAATCRWRVGEMEGALADVDRALERAPDYAPAHSLRGTLRLELGELDAARADFAAAQVADPEYAGGFVGEARVLLQEDRAADAVGILEALLARDHYDPTVGGLLVTAWRQAGLERELPARPGAEEVAAERERGGLWADPWTEELALQREVPEVHHVLRLLQDGMGAEAVLVLERRRLEDPARTDELPLLAEAYYLAGRAAEARATWAEVLELEPDHLQARLSLARYHEAEGEPHLAMPWLQQVVELDPDHGRAWETMGRMLYQGEQFARAAPALERALELDQRNPRLWLWLGASRLGEQRWEEAAQALRSFLEREPESGPGHLFLAKALVKLGDPERARAELALAREHGTGRRGVEKGVENAIERAERREQRPSPGQPTKELDR